MSIAQIALGSNLGSREKNLHAAIQALDGHSQIKVQAVSRYWETIPVGGPAGQTSYLNAAATLETTLNPQQLLTELLRIETDHGRIRAERFGPRTLDLDILLFDQKIIHEPNLTIPHPRLHERTFMLGPLVEIAPQVTHPIFQRTMVELLSQLSERPLQGKKVLVTGSSSGIGKAIALKFAAQGADVLIHARASLDRGKEVVQQIRNLGCRSEMLQADLAKKSDCDKLVETSWQHWGSIDIAVLNAGADILTGTGKEEDYLTKLQKLLAVDVVSTMLLGKAFGQRMKEAGQGSILTMGWDQAETGMEGDSGELFSATKAAVMAFTKALAINVAPQVRVNCIAPGWIKTSWGQNASNVWQTRAKSEAPLGRWGLPEEVADTAAWLVSTQANFITGQVIRVNGGAIR